MPLRKYIFSASIFCSMIASANDKLPIPPEQLSSPYQEVKVKTLFSASDLITLFNQYDYELSKTVRNSMLPPYFIENLPNDLNNLSEQQKISVFIRLLLPTIKAVNNQILMVRHKVDTLSNKPISAWSSNEVQWLNQLYSSYNVESNDIQELLLHLDIIPIGMALSQGIDESGWGTSYFAIKGNNLYGEHLPTSYSNYLTTPNGHVKVAIFDNLYQSTASYMYNLNTTSDYKQLWSLRKKLRKQNNLTGYELVQALSSYSIRGDAYLKNLRTLINRHHLDSFDNVSLQNQPNILVRFAR